MMLAPVDDVRIKLLEKKVADLEVLVRSLLDKNNALETAINQSARLIDERHKFHNTNESQ